MIRTTRRQDNEKRARRNGERMNIDKSTFIIMVIFIVVLFALLIAQHFIISNICYCW